MNKTIAAYTKAGAEYPGYVNATREDDGTVSLTVRADPQKREGCFICGHASDKGKLGRCTPGDDNCNNYCNMAPQKGPMQDAPLPCTQIFEGDTSVIALSADEWDALVRDIKEMVE